VGANVSDVIVTSHLQPPSPWRGVGWGGSGASEIELELDRLRDITFK
jgi:hypothetical protein